MNKLTFNRTKIIATVGPASRSKETLKSLVLAGVDVFRLNFSHGNHEQHEEVIARIHEVNKELGALTCILADLSGPKIRLGDIEDGEMPLEKGQEIQLTTQAANKDRILVNYVAFAKDVTKGDRILLDDGKVALEVLHTNEKDEVDAKVIYGTKLRSKKGVNLPDSAISSPSLTDKDLKDLAFILTKKVNWIALSFVRSAGEVVDLKRRIAIKGHSAKVISKIEKPEALKHIDAIIKASDGVMVARGDLGVEIPSQKVPLIQKNIVQKCIENAKPVIIATQVMESMMENPFPTRAEVTDVANAMFGGADAIMLSGETAVGKHPVKVIEMIDKIITEIEREDDSIYYRSHTAHEASKTFLADAICYNACKIAQEVKAKAVIGMTLTGYTAFMLSSYRTRANVFIFSSNKDFLRAANLIWGVRAFYYNKKESTDSTIEDVQLILKEKGFVKEEDIVVNIASMPLYKGGKTNTIKISRIK